MGGYKGEATEEVDLLFEKEEEQRLVPWSAPEAHVKKNWIGKAEILIKVLPFH